MATVVDAAKRLREKKSSYVDQFLESARRQNAAEVWRRVFGDAANVGAVGLGASLTAMPSVYMARRLRDAIAGKPAPEEGTQQFEPARVPVHKAANFTSAAKNTGDRVASGMGDWLSGVLSGSDIHSAVAHPAYLPAVVGTGAASLYAGNRLSNFLSDWMKKRLQRQEIESAKKDYEAALAGQTKRAKQLHEDLDAIHDVLQEKSASMSDLAGTGLGLYLLYALGSGAAGFAHGKGQADATSRKRLLEQAQRIRRQRKYLRSPIPITAESQPIGMPTEEEAPSRAAPSFI